ncbi:MAG: hypothetical protein FE78DRAFT_67750 [Acidomyces sp. 'richmondensis']|nr:MAG: hypothetical protein FE78DRAFT_67750 [Acidomyces sp. 'richmondensis']
MSSNATTKSNSATGVKRVKTGCITCRIRRVKCDEKKPACFRCVATGRHCDGYSSLPFSRRDLQAASSIRTKTLFDQQHHTSEYFLRMDQPSEFQISIFPQLVNDPTFSDVLEKAIIQTRFLASSASPEDVTKVLTACCIFISYAGCRGDYAASQIHMRSGRSIIISNKSTLSGYGRRQDFEEICRVLFRLDIPALTFQDAAGPSSFTLQEFNETRPLIDVPDFDNLEDAQASLIDLVRWHLVASDHFDRVDDLDISLWLSHYDKTLANCTNKLHIWDSRFRRLLRNRPDLEEVAATLSLRLCHIIADQPRFDSQLPEFDRMISLAERIVAEIFKTGNASFSVELGYIVPTFLVASRCRHPTTRRRAIRLLQSHQRQEGVWESFAASVVAQRWMEIEEEGCEVTTAADVPECNRIEVIESLVNVEEQTARLRFTIGQSDQRRYRDEIVYFTRPFAS